MKRGDLFRVPKPSRDDPKGYRVVVIVSRQQTIDGGYSSVICAPIYSHFGGLSTQVLAGVDEGLKHQSAIHCDNLYSIEKSKLTYFVGSLSAKKLLELDEALKAALDLS